MKQPINPNALRQIRALIDLIEQTNDPDADCKVYVSEDYVSVEVTSGRADPRG